MKSKIAMIQPYFGTLPNYFDLALQSYAFNSDYDWYIFTDDRSPHNYPPNVFVTHTTLDRLKARFQQHFDFPVALKRPYKLIDYKPLYGHLFADYLKGYDFWGHFDPDVIFGDLNKFIKEELFQQFDKFCLLGHFSLYRNTPTVNLLYQLKVPDCLYYKDVIASERYWAFDEHTNGVNVFFAAKNLKIYTECPIADIYFREYAMRLLYRPATEIEKSSKSCFAYEQGGVYRYYWQENEVGREEFMYIHLQKRKMAVRCSNPCSYLMYGNAFREMEPITKGLLAVANKNRFIYRPLDQLKLFWNSSIKSACRMLFVERNYRKFVVRLLEKCRLMEMSRRKA